MERKNKNFLEGLDVCVQLFLFFLHRDRTKKKGDMKYEVCEKALVRGGRKRGLRPV